MLRQDQDVGVQVDIPGLRRVSSTHSDHENPPQTQNSPGNAVYGGPSA